MEVEGNCKDGESSAIFSLENLRKEMRIDKKYFYKVIFTKNNFYHGTRIPKRKPNEYRELLIPHMALKNMQVWILENILYNLPCHHNATGFIPGKSIVDNALPHIKKEYILKMDIKDFFPNIDFYRVRDVFFNLNKDIKLANALANICTYEKQLPQGAPTSPYLSNLICIDLDKRISQLCLKHNLSYTRYADDITISGNKNIFWIKNIIGKILNENGFTLNKEKTVILKPGDMKRVTGLVVNETLSIPKETLQELRQRIYYIKRFGLKEHLERIGYREDEQKYIDSLYGLASFIKMVDISKGLSVFNTLNAMFKKI